MRKTRIIAFFGLFTFHFFLFTPSALAMTDALHGVYERRGDLQNAFLDDGTPIGGAAGFLLNLEDWARQYGWQEYPELASYAPLVAPPSLQPTSYKLQPLTTSKYIVIDDASGAILAAEHADTPWPIASITKLMSTSVALDSGIDVGGRGNVLTADDVGGAKLHVVNGTTFTTRDLLAATIVGSANNAANAIARMTGLSKDAFVAKMNDYATMLGMNRARFVDPTGIELGNTATAREVAALAASAFRRENIRTFAGSSKTRIAALSDATYVRDIASTDWMLFHPDYDDLYVTAGKTGFLNESGWNLVVQLHPMKDGNMKRSLTIVTLGSSGRRESFDDAAALARTTWKNFTWE